MSDSATGTVEAGGTRVEDETPLEGVDEAHHVAVDVTVGEAGEPDGGGTDESHLLAGRFRLLEQVPSDLPDAEAWKGHDQVLDRPIHALVLRGPGTDETADAARRAAGVTDARVPRTIKVGPEGDGVFVVTDAVHGQSLGELVESGPLPPAYARAIIGEAASALEEARRRGMHHLALRPSTIRLTPHSEVVVTGLGVDASQLGVDLADFHEASRADAVGLVHLLYLALTGTPADPSGGGESLAAPLKPDVPSDLSTLCVETLGPDDAGPRSPAELIRALAPWEDLSALRREVGPGSSPLSDGGVAVHASVDETAPDVTGSPSQPDEPQPDEPQPDEPQTHEPQPHEWVVPEPAEPDDATRAPFDTLLEPGSAADERQRSLLRALILPVRHARVSDVDEVPAVTAPVAGDPSMTEAAAAEPPSSPAAGDVAPPRAIRKAASSTGRVVGAAATAGGRTLGRAAVATGRVVGGAAVTTGHAVGKVAATTGHAAGRAGATAERAAERAGAALGKAGGAVRKAYGRPVEDDAEPAGRFDPTPYVLALMLGLVLFGVIWALDVLDGDPSQEVRRRPISTTQTAPAQEPDATPSAEADPDPADPATP